MKNDVAILEKNMIVLYEMKQSNKWYAFFVSVPKQPGKNNLKGEIIIFANGFRDFGS